jgi:hypothetical protein
MERWNQESGVRKIRVTIEVKTTPAPTPDTRGHPNRLWSTLHSNVSCALYTPTGHKLEIARQLVSTATHQAEMQYRGLDPNKHRLNYKGRIFNIGHSNDVDFMHVKEILTMTEQKAAS